MALSNAEKFVNLGMPTQLAVVVAEAIAAGPSSVAWSSITGSAAGVSIAVKDKAQINALTSSSTAADIVAALKA